MEKKLSFIIKTSQEFVRISGEDKQKNNSVINHYYDAISNIYLPLLNIIENLQEKNCPCNFGLVLPPVVCCFFASQQVKKGYIEFLEKKIQLGKKELERNQNNEQIIKLVQSQIEKNQKLKYDFCEKYNKNLIAAFSSQINNGTIELIGTCATDIFIPHYSDFKEILSAQIECGLSAYRYYFGIIPEGFWLPFLGYTPGIEKLIKAYGYLYTIIDSRSLLFSQKMNDNGIFYPNRTENSLGIFTKEPYSDNEILGENGFSSNVVYRNENRDIGFELPIQDLSSIMKEGDTRFDTGYKYFNRCFDNENEMIYDEHFAITQAKNDSNTFICKRNELLNQAQKIVNKNFVMMLETFDLSEISYKWNEFSVFFENLFIEIQKTDIQVQNCNKLLGDRFDLDKIVPYYSSSSGSGYGENLLSSKNCWMNRYTQKACERMIELAERFPNDTGLKNRLLNLSAKEIMIALSGNFAKMLDEEQFPEFAERRFTESIKIFTTVFESLGSNIVSTEWLTTIESLDNFFPWMNYRIFSKKR